MQMIEKDPSTASEERLPSKKKRAMLEYLAIMFAVAFLLVAVSLLIKVGSMQDDLDAINAGASMNISYLEKQLEAIRAENDELQTSLTIAEQTARANELLLLAQYSSMQGDTAALEAAVAELEDEDLIDLLSASMLEIYETLK